MKKKNRNIDKTSSEGDSSITALLKVDVKSLYDSIQNDFNKQTSVYRKSKK